MDESTDPHTADQLEIADTPNPFELDYTPSMRQVGTGMHFRVGIGAQGTLSVTGKVASEKKNCDFVGGTTGSLNSDGDQIATGSEPGSHDFAGLTAEVFEQMTNADVAELIAQSAGICSAGCVTSLRDVDFKGHWGDEAHLTAAIVSKVNPMDQMLIIAALSQMHEFVAKIAAIRPPQSSSPPSSSPPPEVKSHLR
jgi:hypothetical protein